MLVTIGHTIRTRTGTAQMRAKAVSSIIRCSAKRLFKSPASLARKDRRFEARSTRGTGAIAEGRVASERNVVEAEVPDTRVDHAVRRQSHDRTDAGTSEDIVPVVIFINGQSAADEHRAEDGSVGHNQLPERGVVVGPDLELGVKVEIQEDEAAKSCGGMTAWERLYGVINLILVASADATVVHDRLVAIAGFGALRNHGLAHDEEVGTEAANQALEEDLENGGGDEGVQETDDGVVDVPEAANANLHDQDNGNRDHRSQESGKPNRHDFVAKRIGEFGIDNLTVLKQDGKGATGSGRGLVEAKLLKRSVCIACLYLVFTYTQDTHEDHGEDIAPGHLQPLPERRSLHSKSVLVNKPHHPVWCVRD